VVVAEHSFAFAAVSHQTTRRDEEAYYSASEHLLILSASKQTKQSNSIDGMSSFVVVAVVKAER
jgi:hypothetical protein